MTVKEKVEKFLTDTQEARELSEKCRDYKDGKQWTEQEVAILEKRQQAPIVVNRIKPKVEGLVGLYNMRKSDPKGYPRTKKDEPSSHVVTDGLRYVADNNDFDTIRLDVCEDFFVEGYGGVMVGIKAKSDGPWISIDYIPWDRIYFDPHSRAKDFKDARWMGIIMWMYREDAKEKFKGVDFDSVEVSNYQDGETFHDRPKWVDGENDRIRLALHFEEKGGVWSMEMIAGDVQVIKNQPSPYLDEDGIPTNPIELVSAHIDRENGRYGEVKMFLSQQDEINHRRSKFLHMLNSRQTFGRKGAQEDVSKIKRELAKPDGHVEFEGEQWGKDFGVFPATGNERGQFELYQDGKSELDAVSFNAQLAGERQSGDLSGVAIGRLQQAGTIELNRQYQLLSTWEKRVYRQIWCRQKQSYTAEKWIRITDDADSLRWVGFNTPITVQEALEEKINDESEALHVRRMAAATYTQLMEAQDPRLQETVEVRNNVPELDMDILLDQSFDVINAEEEQFRMLAQFGQSGDVDLLDLIEVSQLRNRDKLIEKIEQRRKEAAQAQGGAVQMEMAERQAKTENIQADTVDKFTKSQQRQVETEMLIQNPDPQVQAIV